MEKEEWARHLCSPSQKDGECHRLSSGRKIDRLIIGTWGRKSIEWNSGMLMRMTGYKTALTRSVSLQLGIRGERGIAERIKTAFFFFYLFRPLKELQTSFCFRPKFTTFSWAVAKVAHDVNPCTSSHCGPDEHKNSLFYKVPKWAFTVIPLSVI